MTSATSIEAVSPELVRSGSGLSARTFRSWEELAPFRSQWNHLVSNSWANEVFSTFNWLEAWSQAGTRPCTPQITMLFEHGEPVAIAPLMTGSRRICGVPLRTLEFIGTPNSDYSDFIYSERALLPRLWEAVIAAARGIDVFSLQQIKESSPTWRYLKTAPRMRVNPCVIGLSTVLPETPDAAIKDYVKGGIRAKTLRRIEKEGAVELRIYEQPSTIQENLPVLFAQHIRRWSETPTPSFFRHECMKQLYRNFTDSLSGSAMLAVLTLNDRPVACLYGFRHNRKLVVHTLSFDPEYHRFHCGLVCILKVMQAGRRYDIDTVDFTRGTERYKAFFADIATLSYAAVGLRTAKANLLYGPFLFGRQYALTHPAMRKILEKFGLAPPGVDPAELSNLHTRKESTED